MLVKAAKSQWLIVDTVSAVEYRTDPIPLDGADRVSGILVVRKVFGGTVAADRSLVWSAEVSNGMGQGFLIAGSGEGVDDVGTTQAVVEVHGAYVQFRFVFALTSGPGPAGALFDLDVLLIKA